MELLTNELMAELPALYAQENVGAEEKWVYAKFFCPWSNWTWFVTEGQEEEGDFLFFGFVQGFEGEWGYFVLSELEEVRGPGGLGIERDLYFQPGPWGEVAQREGVE